MNLLTVEKITKTYGDKSLFNEVSFGINEGDKIGIIGINGTGKSTLLKMLAGVVSPETGNIVKMNGLRIGYLPQTPVFESGATVISQVFRSENAKMQLVMEYEKALKDMESGVLGAEERVISISAEMDKTDAWGLESEAKTILTRLGINDYNKNVDFLSGGQRKRIAMAGALISPVDILILDEPTNHIDNETIDWLEKYLGKYSHCLVMVTHDRYFLDRVVNKTIELDNGDIFSYEANYSKFLELKDERMEMLASGERKRQNFLRRELEWVRRGAQARSTKQKARLERFDDVSAIKKPKEKENIDISVGSTRLGRKTMEIKNIGMDYDDETYIEDFSYIILKDDRIGIIGANGCGKSTLLKIITGRLQPTRGEVETGETVHIGIFDQENTEMNPEQRVIDYIKDIAEYVQTADGRISASQMLEKFLFTSGMQWSPIGKLSGGEKRRLYLLKVLMDAPNILFLDEPTNDLDIQTLSILEEYLEGFSGAVIAVSHDRYFLDKMAGKIFAFEGRGKITRYEGNYSDYKRAVEERGIVVTEEKKTKELKTGSRNEKPDKRPKMTFKEQREFELINDDIIELESELKNIDSEMHLAGSDYMLLQELTEKKKAMEDKLEFLTERWMYLTELSEKIDDYKKNNTP